MIWVFICVHVCVRVKSPAGGGVGARLCTRRGSSLPALTFGLF